MALNTDGTYSQVTGATNQAVGNVIPSATWNSIHSDLGTAIQQINGQVIAGQSIGKNLLFGNGGFEVWQRGAGVGSNIAVGASSTAYTADRWYLFTSANQASGVSAAAALTNQSGLSAKYIRTAGQTGVAQMLFGYPLDNDSIQQLRGQKVNISFTAKAGVNWSPAGGILTCQLATGVGSPVKVSVGYTSQVLISNFTAALTTGVTRFTNVGIVLAGLTITQAELLFVWTPVGTAGADDSFTIDDVQVEIQQSSSNATSTVWTTTQYDRVPYEFMLADCQAHFQKTFPYGTAPAQNAGTAGCLVQVSQAAAAKVGAYIRYSPPMRTIPVHTTYNPQGASANWQDITGAVSVTVVATATSSTGIFIYSSNVNAASSLVYIHYSLDAGI